MPTPEMSVPLWCLLGFVCWTLVLLLAVGVARVRQVLAGEVRANEFPSGVPHGSDAYWRLNRAHLNCVENLPLFAAVILVGAAARIDHGTFDNLALLYICARIGQSLTHIASGSEMAVNVRFSFFGLQIIALLGCMAVIATAT